MADRVYEIYSMLEPKPKELLQSPSRKFVHEGPVILWNDRELKKKDRHFFMFNDVLLIAKRLNGAKMKYRLRVYITLRTQVKVVDVPDSSDVCEFRILAPTKTFVLFGRNKEEKLNWVRWINNTINGRPMNEGGDDKAASKKKQTPTPSSSSKKNRSHKLQDDSNSEDNAAGGSSDNVDDDESDDSADNKAKAASAKQKASNAKKTPSPAAKEQSEEDSGEHEASADAPFAEASEDDEDENVITDNPDIQSFVPVLPEQFFTPSGAKMGIRAGSERSVSTGGGGGAAASRRKGAVRRQVARPPASSVGSAARSASAAPATSTARTASSTTAAAAAAPATAAVVSLNDLFDPLAPATANAAAAKPTVNSLFSAPTASSKPKSGGANPFGGASNSGMRTTNAPLSAYGSNPFGGMPAAQPYAAAFGSPFAAQQQQQPYRPQQQQQSQNPFF